MNRDLSNEEWIVDWMTFQRTIEYIVQRKHDLLGESSLEMSDRTEAVLNRRMERLVELMRLLSDLLMLLRDELNREVLLKLLQSTRELEGAEPIIITGAELDYINRHYGEGAIDSEQEADDGLESAKTVKDSIEKFFKFVPKHKTILHGLNEMLSLGRAI